MAEWDLAWWKSNFRTGFFALLGVAIFWGGFRAFTGGDTSVIAQLKDTATARGLITFLVALATAVVAIILVLAAIISEGSKDDLKQRIDDGRQVLTALIGLLGTIVGFYFGQATTPPASQPATQEVIRPQTQALQIAPPWVSTQQPKAGGAFTIAGFVSGGKAPYTYSIAFTPGRLSAVTDAPSVDGTIRQQIAVPATVLPHDTEFEITVKDSTGATGAYKGDSPLKISGS